MDAFTKIKLSRQSFDNFPLKIRDFISEHPQYFSLTDDLKLCENCDFLFFDEVQERIKFRSADLGNLYFDFGAEISYHRTQKYSLSKEPLAKSLGLTKGLNRVIWDVTCGTAKDSLLISHFGAKVFAFERHPLIYLLLVDAKIHYELPIIITFGDSSQLSLDNIPKPDVIYYDPMYPDKKKSALPRLEMQIFKTVVGPDEDIIEFLKWARTKARDRVVVKRSLHAPKIMDDVNASYEGKSTRYDMYKIFDQSI